MLQIIFKTPKRYPEDDPYQRWSVGLKWHRKGHTRGWYIEIGCVNAQPRKEGV